MKRLLLIWALFLCSVLTTFAQYSGSGSGTASDPYLIFYADQLNRRTRQTLWSAVQMLTQKLCCQTIHDCPKVVPLHYESE